MFNLIEVQIFKTKNGRRPFNEWYKELDKDTKKRVISRISRVKAGYFGDFKNLGDGVFELKLDFGSGYRIYFGMRGKNLIILLCAGNKGSQKRDIEKAKEYWRIIHD